MKRFNFKSAIIAGFIATVVMTIFMAFFGMNITHMLGMALGKTGITAYIYGGIVHLVVGLIYALIFALIIQPILNRLPGFLSGTLYGVLTGIVALIFTPMFMKTLKDYGGNCMPTAASYGYQGCYPPKPQMPDAPQAPQMPQDSPYPDKDDMYPRPDQDGYPYDQRPDNQPDQPSQPQYPRQGGYPYSQSAYPSPCTPQQQMPNAQMPIPHPCTPHQEKKSLPDWLWVLINHAVYGFVLGVFYRPRKIEQGPPPSEPPQQN